MSHGKASTGFSFSILAYGLIFGVHHTEYIFGSLSTYEKECTVIEALVTAEGFSEGNEAGVRGQICVSNQGKYPTENLSIVDTVQVIGKKQSSYRSTTIDLGNTPIIDPHKSYCYPYEVFFEPILEQDVEAYSNISVTITNYTGLEIGNELCPGPDPCSFGPTIVTEFSQVEP